MQQLKECSLIILVFKYIFVCRSNTNTLPFRKIKDALITAHIQCGIIYISF